MVSDHPVRSQPKGVVVMDRYDNDTELRTQLTTLGNMASKTPERSRLRDHY